MPSLQEVRVEPHPRRGTVLRCQLHGEPDALLKLAARHHVLDWSARDRDLEDLFLDFYRVPAVAREDVTAAGR